MSRRFAGAGLMRRAARSVVASAAVEPPGPQVIFGDNLIDEWDSRYLGAALVSGAVDSWVGRKLGLAPSASGETFRPTFTAANAALDGNPSVNTSTLAAAGADRGLRMASDHGSDLVASGARPYLYWIGTLNVFGAGSRALLALNSAAGTSIRADLRIVDADTVAFRMGNDANTQAAYDTTTTTAHLWECIIEADNQLVLYLDGAEVGRDATGATTFAVRRVSIGQFTAGSNFADASHGAMGFCAEAPSSGERAALLAWSQSVWGTP